MRYDADHKTKTRERVLVEAAKAIRREGPHTVGVAEVMKQAGLTHGGFYAHFASRDELVAEAIGQMFKESGQRLARETAGQRDPAKALGAYIDFYLSAAHRDARESGCALPFLSADAPRLPEASRQRYAQGVGWLTEAIATLLTSSGLAEAEAAASSAVAEMVGALALSRAEPDPIASDAILARSKRAVKQRLALEQDQ